VVGQLSSPSPATLAERFAAQLLAGTPARDPPAVVQRLLAVQGQDPRGARLAIRARSAGLLAADVDRALTERRSLLITWLNRGTLHLVRSEDYPWLHALTTPPLLTGNARRLAQEGVTPDAADRGVDAIERSLSAEGPLTRRQLAERIAAAGVRTEGQALVHLLMLACLRGIAVRGPMVGREHAYALVRDWLADVGNVASARRPGSRRGAARPGGAQPSGVQRGRMRSVERDTALAELARRYLLGHGPASDRDLAKWAGLPLRDARAGLTAIASELGEREHGLLALATAPPADEVPPPRLLGPYDPVLLGWTSRESLLGAHREIVTVNGLFRPFALVGGRAVGIWRMPAGRVELEPLDPITREDTSALRDEARDVTRFMGQTAQ
jgi:hypothetical protein